MPTLDAGVLIGLDVDGTKTRLCAKRGSDVVADRVFSSKGWTITDAGNAAAKLIEFIELSLPPSTKFDALVIGAHGRDSAVRCAGPMAKVHRLATALVHGAVRLAHRQARTGAVGG